MTLKPSFGAFAIKFCGVVPLLVVPRTLAKVASDVGLNSLLAAILILASQQVVLLSR